MIDLALLRDRSSWLRPSRGLFTGLAVIGLFSFLPTMLQQVSGAVGDQHGLAVSRSGRARPSWSPILARHLGGRLSHRARWSSSFVLHAAGTLGMLGAVGAGSWMRLLPGLVVAGVGSGLAECSAAAAGRRLGVGSPAAMGSGAQQSFRYLGSCAGVALTIALTTSAHDMAGSERRRWWCRQGLTLVAALGMGPLRERGRAVPN